MVNYLTRGIIPELSPKNRKEYLLNITDADRKRIREWAARHPEINEVHLYGSRARGDNRPDSDIDLSIVVTPSPGDANRRQR